MKYKINTDRTAAVSLEAVWMPVGPDTPRGVKVWMINRPSGSAFSGQYNPSDPFPTHWFPNPTFKKDMI